MPASNHIRRCIDRKWEGNFFAIADRPTENGSLTLCGAEPTIDDEIWRMCGPRHPENLAAVTCETCKQMRQANHSPKEASP